VIGAMTVGSILEERVLGCERSLRLVDSTIRLSTKSQEHIPPIAVNLAIHHAIGMTLFTQDQLLQILDFLQIKGRLVIPASWPQLSSKVEFGSS
jgi:hypothetical protein